MSLGTKIHSIEYVAGNARNVCYETVRFGRIESLYVSVLFYQF